MDAPKNAICYRVNNITKTHGRGSGVVTSKLKFLNAAESTTYKKSNTFLDAAFLTNFLQGNEYVIFS